MMRTTTKRVIPFAAATLVIAPWLAASSAFAAGSDHLQGNLTALNGSGAHSTATATLTGSSLDLTIKSTGLLAGMPHAQHIHIGAQNDCPAPGKKGTGVDGHLTTTDGHDNYGMIAYSLTTSGDTSPKSALAVTRFPAGNATYHRTITLDARTAAAVRDGKAVIVQHGLDYNKDGKYSGDATSDLDPSLPEEATDPATCGVLKVSQMSSMPGGGVQTGGGSTAGIEDAGLLGLGATLFAGGAALMMVRRRQTSDARS